MTIGDLKGWLKSIPDTFDHMNVIQRKYEVAEKDEEQEDNNDLFYAIDVPLVSGFIDEENEECVILDEKSKSFIVKMNKVLKEKDKK